LLGSKTKCAPPESIHTFPVLVSQRYGKLAELPAIATELRVYRFFSDSCHRAAAIKVAAMRILTGKDNLGAFMVLSRKFCTG
jgi:hypothetical protein